MALPNYYKFHIYNGTGVTLDFSADDTFTITAIPYKTVDGVLTYGSRITLFAQPTADVATGAMLEAASEVDNSSNDYEGLFCKATLVSDDSPDGNLEIYWEWSEGDGAADTYPSDSGDFDATRLRADLQLAAIMSPAGASDDQLSIPFHVFL
jgi:hypothetical protein